MSALPASPAAPPVGFLPAAGKGVRFGASGYVKELFPLLFSTGGEEVTLEPRPICEFALRAIRRAGAEQCVVLLSPEKAEVLRVLGDGGSLDMSLAYIVQPQPRGLPSGVRHARAWLDSRDVVFALPDTIVLPPDALARVHARRLEAGADVALGVFPVEEPERLGPVEMAADGRVLHVHDKPGHRQWPNSWAVASWSPRFTAFCAQWDAASATTAAERALGHAFEAAREAGHLVVALEFPRGRFLDIGTPAGLRAALKALAAEGTLDEFQAAFGASP